MTHADVPPRPGPHNPVSATPPRARPSVRRTTTADITFPEGIGGRVIADVRGRDLRTDAVGATDVLDELAVNVEIEPWTATIAAVDATHVRAPLDALVGLRLRGLSRRVEQLFPDDAAGRSLLYSAFEDLSGAYLVSGYAGLRAGLIETTPEVAELAIQTQGDVCIGWAVGGSVIETIRATGRHAVPFGPAAPALEDDDEDAWHAMARLPAPSVRRRRRTDVPATASDDAPLLVEHHFRDSFAGGEGEEVLHEYLVSAVFDRTRRLSSIDVDARVLPWYECPGATASAQRLVGTALDEIAARVRSDFTGATTCTHLNSTLRTLADVRVLACGAA